MKAFYNLIKKRPIITLTILYILFLISLDQTGYFLPAKRSKILPFATIDSSTITGRMISEPETGQKDFSFVFETRSVNGLNLKEKTLVRYSGGISQFISGDILQIQGRISTPLKAKNPGSFDYETYLARQGIYTIIKSKEIKKLGHTPINLFLNIARYISNDASETIKKYIPEKEASVLLARVIGDRKGLSKETKEEFTDAGVMHMLVVSGINVAYVSLVFLGLFRLFGFSKRKAALFSIPFIFLYALITGANPPVMRACLMAVFVIFSFSLEREPLIYQSLALSALIILILDPQALFGASFQMSFAATVGIVYLYPYLILPCKKAPFWFKNTIGTLFAVSIGAQAGVFPLLIYYFNKFSIAGILTNLIAVPIGGIATSTGIILYLVHFLGDTAGKFFGLINYFLTYTIIVIVEYFSKQKYSIIHIATPSVIFMTFYYIFLFSIFKLRKYPKLIFFIMPLIISSGIFIFSGQNFKKSTSEVTFLSIPHSDSVHIRFSNGSNYLINAPGKSGPGLDPTERIIIPYLWSKGINKIDRVFVTSSDFNHYGGLKLISDNFSINEIILNPQSGPGDEIIDIVHYLKDKGVKVKEGWKNDKFKEDNSSLEIMAPNELNERKSDNSLVLILNCEGRKILLAGDAGFKEAKDVLAINKNLKPLLLQMPQKNQSSIYDSPNIPPILINIYHQENILKRKVIALNDSGSLSVILNKNYLSWKEFSKS